MHRRTFLAASLLVLTPRLVRADSPPPLAIPLEIEAAPRVLDARSGSPTEAFFVLRNRGREPMEVRAERLVALVPGMRLPLRITGVAPSRALTLAPGQQVELRVGFEPLDGPAARGPEWTFELTVRAELPNRGHYRDHEMGTTTVRRAPVPPG